MQSDAQLGILPREFHRLFARDFVHHQAGRSEDPFPMRANDRFVDGMRAAEIVGVHYQSSAAGNRHSCN